MTISPDTGSRIWTDLVQVENGVAIKMDSKPLYQWFTDSGQRPCDEWLGEQGYYGVVYTDAPAIDPLTQKVSINPLEQWIVDTNTKTVTTTWTVDDLSDQEIDATKLALADYGRFWDALITSSIYSAIREQAFVSLQVNTLATELIALLGDAKAGRPNELAIQASIGALLASGGFTQDQLADLHVALEAGCLDTIYTIDEEEQS